MIPFTYARADRRGRRRSALAGAAGAQVPRRRHQPRRPDAREHRAAGRAGRRHRALDRGIEERADGGLRDRRGGHATPRSPRTARVRDALSRCCRAPSWPAPRRRSATWRRSAATCCSARAASTSTTTPARCNKREPGAGCDAIDGFNRIHAILGASPACIATHPVRHVRRAGRARRDRAAARARTATRTLPLADFHRLPGDTPDIETELQPGELITAVELPPLPFARALDLPQGARPGQLRLRAGLGRRRARGRRTAGHATCGSRSAASRTSRGAPARRRGALRGAPATRGGVPRRGRGASWRAAGRCATTRFKIELAKRTIVAVLAELAGGRA